MTSRRHYHAWQGTDKLQTLRNTDDFSGHGNNPDGPRGGDHVDLE